MPPRRPVSMIAAMFLAVMIGSCATNGAPLIAGAETSDRTPTPADAIVETRGQVTIDGRPLAYTARTGLLPIYDGDTGELMARMFMIAYVADRNPGEPARPITFVWNGGPGASSSLSHLVGFGPMGFDTPPTYPEWDGAPENIVERPETWLAVTDLVFVDPISAGYSRATSDEHRERLMTTFGDAEAVAEMIRVYRTRFDAYDAPIFISGESYGTTRASHVAYALARRRAPLAGVVLISGGYNLGQPDAPALDAALQIPAFTRAAHYHQRLPQDLQALSVDDAMAHAGEWARETYAPALENPSALSAAERADILADLERYSGLDSRFVDPATLGLDREQLFDRLLDDETLGLGRYDGGPWIVTRDPSIMPQLDLMQGSSPTLLRYLRDTLGYRSDHLYRGPFGETIHPEPFGPYPDGIYDDWTTFHFNIQGGSALSASAIRPSNPPPLRRAMELRPEMQVFIVHGNYDGSGSCAEVEDNVDRLDPGFQGRVRFACYDAGHMVYSDAAVRFQLRDDFAAFVRRTLYES
ncbi:MAG: hypothetical protein PVI23_04935 [Maricaulaceae bacterium]